MIRPSQLDAGGPFRIQTGWELGYYDPPAFRGVVLFCALPRVCPPACAFEPPSLLDVRMRWAACLRRSPTPFVFFGASLASASDALFGLYSLPTSSTCAPSAASPPRRPTRRSRGHPAGRPA